MRILRAHRWLRVADPPSRSKTVLSENAGQVEIDVPRDRAGTFDWTSPTYESFNRQPQGFQKAFNHALEPWIAKYHGDYEVGSTDPRVLTRAEEATLRECEWRGIASVEFCRWAFHRGPRSPRVGGHRARRPAKIGRAAG